MFCIEARKWKKLLLRQIGAQQKNIVHWKIYLSRALLLCTYVNINWHLSTFPICSYLCVGRLRPDGSPHRPLRQARQPGGHARPLRSPLRPRWPHPHPRLLRLQRSQTGNLPRVLDTRRKYSNVMFRFSGQYLELGRRDHCDPCHR